MFKEFTTIVSAAKEAARKERRLNHFLKLSSEIYRAEQEKERINKDIKEIELDIATETFEFESIDQSHPRYEDKKACHNENIAIWNKQVETLKKGIESYDKIIDDLVQKQHDTVDGKVKMDYDAILERAVELIRLNTNNKFSPTKEEIADNE